MKAKIVQHQRGNHSTTQLLNCGRVIFRGNVGEVRREMADRRKACREQYRNACTNDTMRDFVEYEMADIWAFKYDDKSDKWLLI